MQNYAAFDDLDALEEIAAIVHSEDGNPSEDLSSEPEKYTVPDINKVLGWIKSLGVDTDDRKSPVNTDENDPAEARRLYWLNKNNSYITKTKTGRFVISYNPDAAEHKKDPTALCRNLLIELSYYLLNINKTLPVGWSAACNDTGADARNAHYLAEAIMLPKDVFMHYVKKNTFDARCSLNSVARDLGDKTNKDSYLSNAIQVKERGVLMGLWGR